MVLKYGETTAFKLKNNFTTHKAQKVKPAFLEPYSKPKKINIHETGPILAFYPQLGKGGLAVHH